MPANVGACLRLAAGFLLDLEIVGAAGFPLDPTRIRRAAMDYADLVAIRRWPDFAAFQFDAGSARTILFTTKGDLRFDAVDYAAGDALIFGSESRGAPDAVHAAVDLRVRIPLQAAARSFNLATAAAMALSMAYYKTGLIDDLERPPS